jgi:hypothetical protein
VAPARSVTVPPPTTACAPEPGAHRRAPTGKKLEREVAAGRSTKGRSSTRAARRGGYRRTRRQARAWRAFRRGVDDERKPVINRRHRRTSNPASRHAEREGEDVDLEQRPRAGEDRVERRVRGRSTRRARRYCLRSGPARASPNRVGIVASSETTRQFSPAVERGRSALSNRQTQGDLGTQSPRSSLSWPGCRRSTSEVYVLTRSHSYSRRGW